MNEFFYRLTALIEIYNNVDRNTVNILELFNWVYFKKLWIYILPYIKQFYVDSLVNYPCLSRHIWNSNKCKCCLAGCSAYLLNFAMKILMWLKSGRSTGSSAQQPSIKIVSSSQCRLLSVVGLKYGFWPFRTFWIISVTKKKQNKNACQWCTTN